MSINSRIRQVTSVVLVAALFLTCTPVAGASQLPESTLAPELRMTRTEFREKYLASFTLLAHEAVNEHIRGQINKYGFDGLPSRKDHVLISGTRKQDILIVSVPELLKNTGQIGHVGLGSRNGVPVVYVDSRYFYNERVIGHEKDEISKWEAKRHELGLDHKGMREWLISSPEAKDLARKFHFSSRDISDLYSEVRADHADLLDLDSIYAAYLAYGLDEDSRDINIASGGAATGPSGISGPLETIKALKNEGIGTFLVGMDLAECQSDAEVLDLLKRYCVIGQAKAVELLEKRLRGEEKELFSAVFDHKSVIEARERDRGRPLKIVHVRGGRGASGVTRELTALSQSGVIDLTIVPGAVDDGRSWADMALHFKATGVPDMGKSYADMGTDMSAVEFSQHRLISENMVDNYTSGEALVVLEEAIKGFCKETVDISDPAAALVEKFNSLSKIKQGEVLPYIMAFHKAVSAKRKWGKHDIDVRSLALRSIFIIGAYEKYSSWQESIDAFGEFVDARGRVLLPTDERLHAMAILEDGTFLPSENALNEMAKSAAYFAFIMGPHSFVSSLAIKVIFLLTKKRTPSDRENILIEALRKQQWNSLKNFKLTSIRFFSRSAPRRKKTKVVEKIAKELSWEDHFPKITVQRKTVEAFASADIIVYGPTDIESNIASAVMYRDIREAIRSNKKAVKVLISNASDAKSVEPPGTTARTQMERLYGYLSGQQPYQTPNFDKESHPVGDYIQYLLGQSGAYSSDAIPFDSENIKNFGAIPLGLDLEMEGFADSVRRDPYGAKFSREASARYNASLLVQSILTLSNIRDASGEDKLFREDGPPRHDQEKGSEIRSDMRAYRELVMVPGHGVFIGDSPDDLSNPDKWEAFYPEEGPYYVEHIKRAVKIASEDKDSMLIFTGGFTHDSVGPRSEGGGYHEAASLMGWWGHAEVSARSFSEEGARDSLENILFSILLFREQAGYFPEKITVVGWEFKKERFMIHARALGIPESAITYLGVNDPPGKALEAAKEGERVKLEDALQDPFLESAKYVKIRHERDVFSSRPRNRYFQGKSLRSVVEEISDFYASESSREQYKDSPAYILETIKDNEPLLRKALSEDGFSIADISGLTSFTKRKAREKIAVLEGLKLLIPAGEKNHYRFSGTIRGPDEKYTITMINAVNDIVYVTGQRREERLMRLKDITDHQKAYLREMIKMTVSREVNRLHDVAVPENRVLWRIVDRRLMGASQASSFSQKINNYYRNSDENERIWVLSGDQDVSDAMALLEKISPGSVFDVALADKDDISKVPEEFNGMPVKMLVFDIECQAASFNHVEGVIAALRALRLEREEVIPALLRVYRVINGAPYEGELPSPGDLDNMRKFASTFIFRIPPAEALPVGEIQKLNDQLLKILISA